MKSVSKRELNQQTASVLAAVRVGETVVVTERGEPRWTIRTFSGPTSVLERLDRDGRLRRAANEPAPWRADEDASYTPARVDELFEHSRGEH